MSAVIAPNEVRAPAIPRPRLGAWDWPLVLLTAVLVVFGLFMILSASSSHADAVYGDSLTFFNRQVAGVLLGVGVSIGVTVVPWRWLRAVGYPAAGLSFLGLMLVFTPLAYTANGATRWIHVGVNIQPSEFAKVGLILMLATFLQRNEGRMRDWTILVTAGVLSLGLIGPVFIEPDFGTTVVMSGLVGVMLFVAGLRWRWVMGLGGLGVLALFGLAILEPYRIVRLTSFTDPLADGSGSGYQVVQGWIALASGGTFGNGLATGLAQRGFLPEAHTDFILAVVGEELGGVGLFVFLMIYLAMLWRGVTIASRAVDLYGRLLGAALTAMLAAQAIINLGVVVGWVPAKGLVFPFLSYGASAVVVHLFSVGLLLRVSMETRAHDAQEG
ncbi:MAG: cell division protein FtsW [Deltaproteobacteria bacterium]|nr:cell division protein FtsW [Deltaproteobacteria bacterium]